jgi:predicted glycoside hydrolase/deacetylase ChbG (UPF0249 family)
MNVLDEIAAERKRQIEVEGWTAEHDDSHHRGEIAAAATCYAYIAATELDHLRSELSKQWWGPRYSPLREIWRWDWRWFKPTNRRRDLIKAGALIIAEIERLDRANPNTEAL